MHVMQRYYVWHCVLYFVMCWVSYGVIDRHSDIQLAVPGYADYSTDAYLPYSCAPCVRSGRDVRDKVASVTAYL